MRTTLIDLDMSGSPIVDITDEAAGFVQGVGDGLLSVFAPHAKMCIRDSLGEEQPAQQGDGDSSVQALEEVQAGWPLRSVTPPAMALRRSVHRPPACRPLSEAAGAGSA